VRNKYERRESIWPGGEVAKFSLNLIAVFGLVISIAAQAPPPAPGAKSATQVAADAEAADRGHTIFKQNCVSCHGEDATGGRGPDLIRSSLVRHDKGGDLVGPVVAGGRSDKGMPAFPLSQSQVGDLVAFIQAQLALFDLHTRQGPYPNDIPAERLATGTVEAGKAYFNGAGGCSGCHSPTGDLAGIAKKFNPPDLEVRFLYPSGSPTTAAVTLPSGEKFEGRLMLNDGFNVAITSTDGWYHSWPASAVKVETHDPLAAHAALLEKYTDADMHNIFTYLETLK
jgi:cytochrome c oxidase cbb3-type subunit III